MDPNNPANSQLGPSSEREVQGNNVNTTQQRSSQQKVTKLKLVSKTWIKDSYGLFDYQVGDAQYERYTEYLQESVFIVRDNRTCKTFLVKDLKEVKERYEKEEQMKAFYNCLGGKEPYTVVGQLVVDKQRRAPSFKLKPFKKPQQEQPKASRPESKHSHHSKKFIPFIFAEPKSNGCLLFPGSIIKFGRVQYLVLESFNGKETKSYCNSIYYEDEEQNVFDVLKEKTRANNVVEVQDKDNMNCKICLCNDETLEDPLISPCSCKGYCGLIHVNCLRQWINNKVKKETIGMAASYNFTKFECQICKAPFPKIIRTQADVEVQMMKIQKPQKPYIMLQSLDPTGSFANPHPNQPSNQKQKLLHVISTDEKNPIKIGRANECEIRLMDISVSRKHAEIKLVDGNFYIKDTGAKFGTLVEMVGLGSNSKQDIIINKKKPLKIQLGRTSYEFTVEDINEEFDTQ